MYNYRVCYELGHQNIETSHLCTFKECDYNVFLCAICIQKDKHKHIRKSRPYSKHKIISTINIVTKEINN